MVPFPNFGNSRKGGISFKNPFPVADIVDIPFTIGKVALLRGEFDGIKSPVT
jgi:hypothetical protein